jgi:hypothetical protein
MSFTALLYTWTLSVFVLLLYQLSYRGLGPYLPQSRLHSVVRLLLRPLRVILVWHPLPAYTQTRREALVLEASRNPRRAISLLRRTDPALLFSACLAWRELELPSQLQDHLLTRLAPDRELSLRFVRSFVTDPAVLRSQLPALTRDFAPTQLYGSIEHELLWAVSNCKALRADVLLSCNVKLAYYIATYVRSNAHG